MTRILPACTGPFAMRSACCAVLAAARRTLATPSGPGGTVTSPSGAFERCPRAAAESLADLQLACHQGHPGHYDIYGRMWWDRPAPTLTSGCTYATKGRFGHLSRTGPSP